MAEAGAQKSRGLQFAERQLLRHGWEQGKGLGRDENGISEAIKVKVKCDKGGVGHKEGDQFTFHWWDHVFNKTSASLEVQSEPGGAALRKSSTDNDCAVSNKRPLKANLAKDRLYGAFVKSATLVSGREQVVGGASSSDSSSSDDDETQLDLSSTTKLSDTQLMKACGGRTAHKGARHGLNMSAKLARLEQQEAEFMAKYGNKAEPAKGSSEITTGEGDTEVTKFKKKKKKKRKSQDYEVLETEERSEEAENGHEEEEEAKVERKKKKKKKKKRDSAEEGVQVDTNDCLEEQHEHETQPPKKKKKKKKNKE